jgi:hypothetical protein
MEKTAFIIMPFSKTNSCTETEWSEIFDEVFKPSLLDIGYNCERAQPETGSLIRTILKKLQDSFIVIADITDRNANVFYELGVRHALSKRTIIVAQDYKHIPSDLLGYWSIIYNTTPKGVTTFKKDIKRIIENIEKKPFESDSPISDFIDKELYGISNQTLKYSLKKLIALRTELSGNINTITEIKTNQLFREILDHQCLDVLTSTLYVDLGIENLKEIFEYRSILKITKSKIPIDNEFLDEAIYKGEKLLATVGNVINKISKGEFEEPQKISSTIWTPQKKCINDLQYSKLAKFDFDINKIKE